MQHGQRLAKRVLFTPTTASYSKCKVTYAGSDFVNTYSLSNGRLRLNLVHARKYTEYTK